MEIWETITMKLTKTKLRQIIKEEIESEGLGDSITKAFRSNVGQGAGAGAIAGLGLATALAGPAGAGIALPLIAMANGATVGALTGMIGDDLLDRATETWQKLGDEAKVQLKNMGKKIGLSEDQRIIRKQIKLTKTKLQEIIQEELQTVLEKDDNWIQDAEKDIEKRGTEGVCTGDKFGSDSCPEGSKRYNLAKTFRKMAKDKKKD